MPSQKKTELPKLLGIIYIYIYIYIITVLVVTKSLCGFVSNQVQYYKESAQYLI